MRMDIGKSASRVSFCIRIDVEYDDAMLNDQKLGIAKGVDVYPTVANPTSHNSNSNPVGNNFTDELGEGAGRGWKQGRHRHAARNFGKTAGVIEARPGIIETCHIDPLNESSLYEDEWKNPSSCGSAAPTTPGAGGAAILDSAAVVVGGSVRMAYGALVGDEQAKQAGKEAVYGKGA